MLALKKPGGKVTVMRSKDRVFKPLPSGYRDVLLNITIEGCDMVMELQLHLKDGRLGSTTTILLHLLHIHQTSLNLSCFQ